MSSQAEVAMLDAEQQALVTERDVLLEWVEPLRAIVAQQYVDAPTPQFDGLDKIAELDERLEWLNRRIEFNQDLDDAAAQRDLLNDALTDATIDRLRADLVSIANQVSSRMQDVLPGPLKGFASRPRFILAWSLLADRDPFGIVPRVVINRDRDGFDPPVVEIGR